MGAIARRRTSIRSAFPPDAAGASTVLEALECRRVMAVDPVTPNNPVWFATYGSASVDGTISAGEWAGTVPVVRTNAGQSGSSITIRFMYNQQGMSIAADVRDTNVWSDGNGRGSGNRWEFTADDGLGVYFDPLNNRRKLMGTAGRFLGVNLGRPLGPQSGNRVVTRYDYLKGNGQGWGTNVNPGGALTPGTRWKTSISGTINNNADVDVGWTMEMFLPWAAINMPGMPASGQFIGTNFQVFNDDIGGIPKSPSDTSSPDPNIRLGPAVGQNDVQGVNSSFQYLWSGFCGPINFAQLVFVDPRAVDRPSTIRDLSIGAATGYGAHVNFTAPTTSLANSGSVKSYQIRISTSPITSRADWDGATVVANTFTPKQSGLRESLRIGILSPSTTYYLAARAVDAAGRSGDFATTTFTTQSTTQDTSGGRRLMVSPAGGYLMTESGTPFAMISSPAVANMRYLRSLYPAPVWSSGYNTLTNYAATPGPEGDVAGYFDSLVANGVNTLRVSLEWLYTPPAGASKLPYGQYWLERAPGVFNPAMKSFLQGMMQQAARVGIRLILDPFDTYDYRSNFAQTAYAAQNGGPLKTIDNFFQSPVVLDMSITRMQKIIDWVRQSPYASTVLGYVPINEWDASTWTRNPKGDGDGARTAEMRDRAWFMSQLAARIHAYDPNALLLHSGDNLSPRGPVARAVFNSDAFDVLTPHLYTTTTGEPINNPDKDKSIRPALDYANIAAYWITQRRDNRPLDNGEWGLTTAYWPTNSNFYGTIGGQTWTLAMDTAMYRTTSWVTIASGWDGSGLRLSGNEARSLLPAVLTPETTGYVAIPLPTPMHQIQQSVSNFFSDSRLAIDWTAFNPTTLNGRTQVTSPAGNSVLSFGSTDGDQGLVYLLQDSRRSTGTVANASLSVDGLDASRTYSFEVWSTGPNADVVARFDNVAAVNGAATFTLPSFSTDVVIKFKAS